MARELRQIAQRLTDAGNVAVLTRQARDLDAIAAEMRQAGNHKGALPWSEGFSVGYPELDQQHRRLVGLINEVVDALHTKKAAKRVSDLLHTLRGAAAEHFANESSILWEIRSLKPSEGQSRTEIIDDPIRRSIDEHITEHGQLMKRFDDIVQAPVETIREKLVAWFVDHATQHDSHLKAMFDLMR